MKNFRGLMLAALAITLVISIILNLAGCTDATVSKFAALGNPTDVTCYSGGEVIYQGSSTGAVESPTNSDGWRFKDAETKRLVEVSGDCILQVRPNDF